MKRSGSRLVVCSGTEATQHRDALYDFMHAINDKITNKQNYRKHIYSVKIVAIEIKYNYAYIKYYHYLNRYLSRADFEGLRPPNNSFSVLHMKIDNGGD